MANDSQKSKTHSAGTWWPRTSGILILLLAGCRHESAPTTAQTTSQSGGNITQASPSHQTPMASHGSGYAHVTYRSNVRIMEAEEGKKTLIGVSTNGASLLFDSSSATAHSLHAGDVLLIKGLMARTVLGAESTPDGIVVLTQHALITDVIQDGEIKIQAPVRFGAVRAANEQDVPPLPTWLNLFATPAYAQSPTGEMAKSAEAKGSMDAYGNMIKGMFSSVVSGWDTTFQATPAEGQTNLNITLKRNVGGFAALITGQGSISNFQFDSMINIKQSVLQNMDTSFNNLNGQMNFQWQVAKDDGGVMAEESRIKLPGAIEVPLSEFLDGLPMYLEVSGAILIHPAITGGKEITKGQFQIRYDGNQHFQVKSGNVNTDGSLSGDIQLGDHQDISPTAPLGMVVAFAAPRVELTLGLNKIYDESEIKKAADIVDKIADTVAKHLLNAQQYANYQQNGLHLGDTFKNALSTDGAAFFQMIGTSASSYSGMSSISPCARYDLNLVAQVGASAEVWGKTYASTNKEIFRKGMTRVDPPGMRLCENIGKS
ncbi:hypothetical protein P8935_02445 [Telmatobacter sp. DSM 110680]|uniref:Uncharacterized protein n=1 Tax=Telmatobacter sp. DSM 110680 TaxID=3036704 RepID=A0AAU7DMC2_9BACT